MTNNSKLFISVDVVMGCVYGDESKGKIVHDLLKTKKPGYTHVIRYGGSGNAGHTIYHDGKKYATHQVPAGVFFKTPSIVGPGCVVSPIKLKEEIETLSVGLGYDVKPYVKIAKNTCIITPEHVLEDTKDSIIGTTKQGNGPAYRDKYDRKASHADSYLKDDPYFKDMIIDIYKEFYLPSQLYSIILAEGAQGWNLDIDWGDYPYVTSSHCGVGGVVLNGFSHKHIRDVYGAAKAYDTYVGAKSFEPKDNDIFKRLREIGEEYGVTTKRPRQCNWLNIPKLQAATRMNGVNTLIISKLDVLEKLEAWKVIVGEDTVLDLENKTAFIEFIRNVFPECTVLFSESKEFI